MKREELIQICKDAVVPYTKWRNRDSYAAQVNIASIYQGLCAGINYILTGERYDAIWIEFEEPTEDQINDLSKYNLGIDSREDYLAGFSEDDDPEMFDGNGIDWTDSYKGGYLPTPERLKQVNGGDWY